MAYEKFNRDKFGSTRLGVFVDEEVEEEFDFVWFPFFLVAAEGKSVSRKENSSRFGHVERSLSNSSSIVVPFFLMSENER